ncbi:DUF3823 domain-containing protein [Pedobacter antarcticus]|uniref:DUF3823 domain-containing protein n=1 Tax=Pedobacter antarcticus TaxID=34086 RepID=UPI001C56EA52|nr:DUF3823 domain-containing protein [Pedobacter antarcticus]
MKKLLTKILLGVTVIASYACTKIDNYDGPNASFEGNIISTQGGNLLTSQGSTQIRLEQISWSANPSPQEIPSKFDGTFKDTKLFKGNYRIIPKGGAFWPLRDTVVMEIGKDTRRDFEVTPYLLIKNFTATVNGTTLTLKYNLEAPISVGMPSILETQPYVNTTKLVGAGASIRDFSDVYKKAINKPWASMTAADKAISIDIPGMLPGRTFYVRVGVSLNDSFKSSNFSEIIEVNIPAAK